MNPKLSGRSAQLKQEIERLEQEDKFLRSLFTSDSESKASSRTEVLAKRRQEFERELALKRVVLFGTTHALQENGQPGNSALEERLSYLIGKFDVTVLLEEWAADCPPSFASVFADRLGISYKDVGTPPEEQFRTFANGPINYPGHDGTLGPCEDAPQFYEYGPLDKQENREQRMTQNIQQEMNDHRVGLFIVGLAHLHSISTKILRANFNVATYYWIA